VPGAPGAAFNVPGNNTVLFGIATDAKKITGSSLWLSQSFALRTTAVDDVYRPARLIGFDAAAIHPDDTFAFTTDATCIAGPDGTAWCSNAPDEPCVTADDCVLADRLCAPGSAATAPCVHHYDLPGVREPGMVAVHHDGSVWY